MEATVKDLRIICVALKVAMNHSLEFATILAANNLTGSEIGDLLSKIESEKDRLQST